MLKLCTLLACILCICFAETSHGAPLDSPGTVYIDGTPCNRACQSYMAWSRQVLSRQAVSASSQPPSSKFVQPSSKTKAQRTAKMRSRNPREAAPTRVAKNAAPKRIETAPANKADQLVNPGQAKTPPRDEPDASAAPNPPSPEAGKVRDQAMTSPAEDDTTTATTTPAPENEVSGNTEPSNPPATSPGAGADTTALASPDKPDERVAILLVSPEIKSISDLAHKVIAIDASPTEYSVADLNSAIVAAGATEVQLSEDQRMALLRVIDGDVQAAVVTVLSSKAAEVWSAGVRGFNILRLPLPSPSKAKPG